MNELKYIIVIPKGFNKEGARAIVFNGWINHCDAVNTEGGRLEVHSAGFCSLTLNKKTKKMQIKCFGESTTLNVKSNPKFDQIIIARTLTRNHPLMGYLKV